MSNVVVTKVGNSVNVDFGTYSIIADAQKASYSKGAIELIQLALDGSYVEVYVTIENKLWFLTHDQSYAGSEYFIVDTIDGIAPTSNSHLFDLISDLR